MTRMLRTEMIKRVGRYEREQKKKREGEEEEVEKKIIKI